MICNTWVHRRFQGRSIKYVSSRQKLVSGLQRTSQGPALILSLNTTVLSNTSVLTALFDYLEWEEETLCLFYPYQSVSSYLGPCTTNYPHPGVPCYLLPTSPPRPTPAHRKDFFFPLWGQCHEGVGKGWHS